MPPWLIFVIIGILGGISAGFFGIGGGIIIVPAALLLDGVRTVSLETFFCLLIREALFGIDLQPRCGLPGFQEMPGG